VISVLLADDHVRTRAAVKAALTHVGGFDVCAEASDTNGAIEAALREKPTVCLLDIRMPGNGITAARCITKELPETAVVMLTVSRDDEDLFDALRAGARGYLLKGMDEAQLGTALRSILAGEAVLPGTLVARLIEEFRDREGVRSMLLEGRGSALTGKEWEVLDSMRNGLSTSEIAERLYVSASTVRSHISTILRKLQVADRREAIKLFNEAR